MRKRKEEKMELKVDSERVLVAAERCTNAKAVLQELFPEVFSEKKKFDTSKWSIEILDDWRAVSVNYEGKKILFIDNGGVRAYDINLANGQPPFSVVRGAYGSMGHIGNVIKSLIKIE
jgi:hypothetical protein